MSSEHSSSEAWSVLFLWIFQLLRKKFDNQITGLKFEPRCDWTYRRLRLSFGQIRFSCQCGCHELKNLKPSPLSLDDSVRYYCQISVPLAIALITSKKVNHLMCHVWVSELCAAKQTEQTDLETELLWLSCSEQALHRLIVCTTNFAEGSRNSLVYVRDLSYYCAV